MTASAPVMYDVGLITAQWPRRSHLALGALPRAPSCARLHASAILSEWAMPDLREDACLLVSELVTNSVQHCGGLSPVRLWLMTDLSHLVIMVGDECPEPPVRVAEDAGALSGRGLAIVHNLTGGEWGWYRRDRGKVVWCLL